MKASYDRDADALLIYVGKGKASVKRDMDDCMLSAAYPKLETGRLR